MILPSTYLKKRIILRNFICTKNIQSDLYILNIKVIFPGTWELLQNLQHPLEDTFFEMPFIMSNISWHHHMCGVHSAILSTHNWVQLLRLSYIMSNTTCHQYHGKAHVWCTHCHPVHTSFVQFLCLSYIMSNTMWHQYNGDSVSHNWNWC